MGDQTLVYRRVTPDDVRAAYEATGLEPARTGDDWFTPDGRCGCGMAALCRARKPDFRDPIWSAPYAAETLGLSVPYVHGFVHGFDGVTPSSQTLGFRNPDFALGLEDGRACAAAVFAPESEAADA